jgi:uncharacterized protein (DUF488 family)
MAAKYQLFTIGYAGHDIGSFVNKLREHDVQRVVGIRQNPISRKKGFSKSRLSESLSLDGIGYVHMRELGVPRELRNRLQEGDCTLSEYFAGFRQYAMQQNEALDAVNHLAARERCCLLCVESKPEECHRAVVAELLAGRTQGALHIMHI